MKKLFITLLICILIVTFVAIATRTNLLDNKLNTSSTQKGYDIYKMLEDAKNISNIYLERELSDGSITQIYIKDNMKKLVSDNTIVVDNIEENLSTSYKTSDNKGIIFNATYTLSNDYFNSDYIIYDEVKYNYKIEEEIIDKEICIKVTAISKTTNKNSYIIWFNTNNNLIIKTQEGQDSNNYALFKNIKLNSVTDEDFKIPDDIILIKVNNNN